MALLHDIQTALLDDAVGVGSILLKLRFLAAKLDVDVLEEWVKHESEGYPEEAPVPEYRLAHVTYTGSFANSVHQLTNISIPSYLIEEFAGETWVRVDIREGLPIIETQLKNKSDGAHFAIDASNLKLALQDKIYKGMAIIEISGRIDDGAFTRIQNAVRTKTLDFVLELEKRVSAATEVAIGQPNAVITPIEQEDIKNLTQQVYYGNVTNILTGSGSSVVLSVSKGDTSALLEALKANGIPTDDAEELVAIANQGSEGEKKARAWLKSKLKGGAAEVWGVGKAVASEVVTKALKQYYGLE